MHDDLVQTKPQPNDKAHRRSAAGEASGAADVSLWLLTGRGLLKNLDFLIDSVTQTFRPDFEIKINLEPQPNSGTCAKIPGKSHGCVNRDRSLPMDDLADPDGSYAEVFRQSIL